MDKSVQYYVDTHMQAFLAKEVDDEQRKQDLLFHQKRLEKSIEWLDSLNLDLGSVLEIGGNELTTYLIRNRYHDWNLEKSAFELREPFPVNDSSYDLVICMEVIEHVFDLKTLHAVTLSGVMHVLNEIERILVPGGHLFLTTPNAASFWIIQRVLLGDPPMAWEGHFHEFTFSEIIGHIKTAGFSIDRAETEQVWHFWDFSPIIELVKANRYSLENRGDITFVIASKAIQ